MRSQSPARSAHQSFTRAMLQSAIGAALAFSVAEQNLIYFVLTTLGIAGSWIFAVRPNRPVPRGVINTTLLAVLVVGGIEMLRVGVGINAFAVFIALLLVVKLLDLREPRDEGQVMVLVIAILISAVLTSNSMMTGLLMILVCVQIFRAMVLFQIHAVLHKSAPTDQIIHRNIRIDIRSMITVTAFLCALVSTVVFLVLPRDIGMQAFGQWGWGEWSICLRICGFGPARTPRANFRVFHAGARSHCYRSRWEKHWRREHPAGLFARSGARRIQRWCLEKKI